MVPFESPKDYLFNLYATKSSQAKRIWKQDIKEYWNHECAYCGSNENLTIDHIVPQSKGGPDISKNIVCSCESCNHSKGHNSWEEWYKSQEFFNEMKYQRIKDWIKPDPPVNLFTYRPRRKFV